jgi:hypothetical protein
MSYVLIIVTLYLGTIETVNYLYSGTLEECVTTMKNNLQGDLDNNPDDPGLNYYYCLPHLEGVGEEL